ncbi:MAG: hypothetical protein KDC48_14070 [Planctomycetes bacterium]|nr:hypothetical protein [Planctomycetota bacterium]
MQHTSRPGLVGLCLAAAGLLAGSLLAQKTPDEALRALQEGNRRFAEGKSVPQPLGEGVRRTLARGQAPFAVVVTCADSRVPPEHLFNAGLGELFVIRVAGNVADPEVIASIEYAVEHLQAPLCVVLGHEDCGAVGATIDQVQTLEHDHAAAGPSPAMQHLLEQIEPAVRRARARELGGKELRDACEEENVHLSVGECLRRSSLLRRYSQTGKFRMVPARYHLGSGEVEWLSPRPLPPAPTAQTMPPVHVVPMGMPPHVALRLLQAGHRRFLGDGLPAGDLSAPRREALTLGQRPLAIVLTCADSRVAPEHLFDAGLGELFVIRVAGNTLNEDVLASIEYAAMHTGTSLLVVMGHTRCGAITAAADLAAGQGSREDLTPSMRSLLTRLEPSVEKARGTGARGEQVVDLAVRGNVLRTVAEARARSAVLRQLESQGRFAVLASVYDVGSGDLTWLKEPSTPAEMPAAAPMGETAPPQGGHARDDHEPETAHDAGHEPTEPKHDAEHAAGHDAGTPPLDWADHDVQIATPPQPAAEAHHDAAPATDDHREGHEAPAKHDAPEAHEAHGATDPHHDGHEGHDAHAAPTHPGEHAEAAPDAHGSLLGERLDPIPLVGILGIASLLLAGVIAVSSRR